MLNQFLDHATIDLPKSVQDLLGKRVKEKFGEKVEEILEGGFVPYQIFLWNRRNLTDLRREINYILGMNNDISDKLFESILDKVNNADIETQREISKKNIDYYWTILEGIDFLSNYNEHVWMSEIVNDYFGIEGEWAGQ